MNPLPGPIWLLKTLSYFTFVIHVILMNLAWGGAFLAFTFGRAHREGLQSLARFYEKLLPKVTPLVITFGIAPLLFLQVLRPRPFYSATISMGSWWILQIPLLVVTYSLMYLLAWKGPDLGKGRPWVAFLIWLFLSFFALVFSNAYALMSDPQRIIDHHGASPAGWLMAFESPTLWPRWLHFFLSSIAIAALFGALAGKGKTHIQPEHALIWTKRGTSWFIFMTLIQFPVGIGWLLALPTSTAHVVMGKSPFFSTVFGVAIAAIPVALFGAFRVYRKPENRGPLWLTIGATFVLITGMVILRDGFRESLFPPHTAAVTPQWGAITLFFLFLLLGLSVIIWLLRLALGKSGPEEIASPEEETPRL